MGVLERIGAVFSPPKLTTTRINLRAKPLHEQFQRIGGGIGPKEVSWILAEADSGQPARLIDLFNESRQKDGHLLGACGTRDGAVALCDLEFVTSEEHKLRDKKAIELCERVVAEFDNWPALIEHLTGSYAHGHATAEIVWRKTPDGLLLPWKAEPIAQRDFIFERSKGQLRYAVSPGDTKGVDLLADNPGRIIQVQRRIVGDVQVREGMSRCLVWGALFRNWDLRDWIALGEVGWKPWRIGEYEPGTHQDEIDRLVDALEQIGSSGIGVVPKNTNLKVEWPKGANSSQQGVHAELFDVIGKEMSKAILGQTTSQEASKNGDRASTQTRDQIRLDIRERDAVAVAAALRAHLFTPVVRINRGPAAQVPLPWFQTDEATDQVAFSTMVEKLAGKVRMSAKWVRDELGSPDPKDDEELVESGALALEPTDPNADPNAPPPKPGEKPKPGEPKPPAKKAA